jgi:hypothetical protein
MLIEQGVNIHVVQKVLGHTRVTTTERYTHVAAAQVQDAGNRMAAALWGEDQLQRKRQLRPLAPGNDPGPSRDFPREGPDQWAEARGFEPRMDGKPKPH